MSYLWANPNFGVVGVVDSTNAVKAELLVFEDGTGNLLTWGANGSVNVHLGSANDNSDGGMVNIQDGQDNVVAAMEVDSNGNGVLWATIKNFRIDHPKDPNKGDLVWITGRRRAWGLLPGDCTTRGGEATVILPEEFTLIANLQTMTIMLTPLDASSKGLAVVEKTASGFKVKELHNGDGNYALDWEVKAKRLGHENFKVIRDRPAQSEVQKYGVERKTRNGLPSDDLPYLADPAGAAANSQVSDMATVNPLSSPCTGPNSCCFRWSCCFARCMDNLEVWYAAEMYLTARAVPASRWAQLFIVTFRTISTTSPRAFSSPMPIAKRS